MRRALWFVVKLAIVVAIAVFLADRPGTVAIAWQDRIIEMSVGVLLLIVFLLMVIAAIVFWIWRNAARAPKTVREARAASRRAKGYRALTDGLVAVAAGDPSAAQRQAKRADVLLNEPPLTLLLSAQAAQLDGDEAAAERDFRAMLERPETRFLGLRGLITQAIKRGDRVEALALAREARDMRPDTRWVLATCFELEVAAGQWAAAQHSLNLAVKGKAIDRQAGADHRAAVLLARAREERRAGHSSEARGHAEEAAELRRHWVPAVLLDVALLLDEGKSRAAQRAIEKGWRRQPHPDLAEAYDRATLEAGESLPLDPMVRLRRREALFALTPEDPDSLLIRAESEIEAGLWGAARSHLKRVADMRPTRRVYHVLADLELGEKGDADASRGWLAAAETAPPDPAWTCQACGSTDRDWRPVCGACGAFDQMEWRMPGGGTILRLGEGALLPGGAPGQA
jgi:HemY protein